MGPNLIIKAGEKTLITQFLKQKIKGCRMTDKYSW